MTSTTGHIVLLGDSIFDNQSYTRGEPDVVTHLRSMLPVPWRATLRAIDGATTGDVSRQFSGIPGDSSHCVLSVGGNDALMNIDLLNMPVASSAEALERFGDRLEPFEDAYRAALQALARRRIPITVCTIYNGAFEGEMARRARTALMMFNDVIMRSAFDHRASVIELRGICVDAADYANPIEPSGVGGRKIARAIARAVGALDGEAVSKVFSG